MDKVHYYRGSDWAVRRWDNFHDDKMVEPRSFCQFWRTVIVWATLASLFGWRRRPPTVKHQISWSTGGDRWAPRIRRALVPVGRLLWALCWPGRKGLGLLGRGILTVVDALDTVWKAIPRRVLEIARLSVIGIVIAIVVGVLLFYAALIIWQASQHPAALAWVALGIGAGALTVGIGIIFARPIMATIGAARSLAGLVWSATLAAKHRVCPPIIIVRGG